MNLYYTKIKEDVLTPRKGTAQSVGIDVHAYIKTEGGRANKMLIPQKDTRAIPTGLIVTTKENHAILCCSRSGLAKSHSLFVTNSPGVIDPDYRGELFVLLYNGGPNAYYVEDGQRIAQLIIAPIVVPEVFESLYNLANERTVRGSDGFGSTGP